MEIEASEKEILYNNKIWGEDKWVKHICRVNNEEPRVATHSKDFHRNHNRQLVARSA